MSETKTPIHSSDAPAAVGPYSEAIRVSNFVFASGQVGLDPKTGEMVPGGVTEQTHRAIRNLQAVLAAAGLTLADVVKTTVYLQDMGDFAVMNAAYGEHFGQHGSAPPARSTVQVAKLPLSALVEIDAIAC